MFKVMEIAYYTGYTEEEVMAWPMEKFARWLHFLDDSAKSQGMTVPMKSRPSF